LIASHTRAVEFFGGLTALVVPDQLRSGVKTPCRYEPELQRTYEEWARHYGTAVLTARPGNPPGNGQVEVAVLVAERWVLARLRNDVFHSLADLNGRIGELLEDLNHRRMRLYGASRRELYERLDRPALRALPAERFVYAQWKKARVNIDYHIALDYHFYSVPFALVHEEVETRLTSSTVEVFHRAQRVASHPRSYVRGGFTTLAEHMPKAHQKHAQWTPSRLIHWAESVGAKTAALVSAILADRPHPEQGYRSCLGILRLERLYGKERLEAACARGLLVRARSYRNIDSILRSGLDRVALPEPASEPSTPAVAHENIRGGDYYR
jgi:transposase